MNSKSIFVHITVIGLLYSCQQTNEQLLDKAYLLSKQKNYNKAIEVYTKVIQQNGRLQLAYYNRGFAYMAQKKYSKAISDFDKVITLQKHGDAVIIYNQDSPFADEEARAQVPYMDALYQKAQAKFYMDSLKSSFLDFQFLVDNNYEEKSNCILWQGTLWHKSGKLDKACESFTKAKEVALTTDDIQQADRMIDAYCKKTNNNR